MFQVGLDGAAVRGGHHQFVLEDYVVEVAPLEISRHFDVEVAGPVLAAVTPRPIPVVGNEIQEPSQMKPLFRQGRHRPLRCLARVYLSLRRSASWPKLDGAREPSGRTSSPLSSRRFR